MGNLFRFDTLEESGSNFIFLQHNGKVHKFIHINVD